MVNVEPFIYQKMTAFRERIQMVDKINEIIEVLNGGIDPSEVRAIVTEMLSDYYDKAEIDEMFDAIDLTQYYTKSEIDTTVNRIDGTVSGIEGRVQTNEGDIDALETGKQDVLSAGNSIDLSDNTVSLKDWTIFTTIDWTELFDIVSSDYYAKEDLLIGYSFASTWETVKYKFVPKGAELTKYMIDGLTPSSASSGSTMFPVGNTVGLYSVYCNSVNNMVRFETTNFELGGLRITRMPANNPTHYVLTISGRGNGGASMAVTKKTDLASFLTGPSQATQCYIAIFRRV